MQIKLFSALLVTALVSPAVATMGATLDKSGVVPVVSPKQQVVVTEPKVEVTLPVVNNVVVNVQPCEQNSLGVRKNKYLLHMLFGRDTSDVECVYADRDSGNDAFQEGPSHDKGKDKPGKDDPGEDVPGEDVPGEDVPGDDDGDICDKT